MVFMVYTCPLSRMISCARHEPPPRGGAAADAGWHLGSGCRLPGSEHVYGAADVENAEDACRLPRSTSLGLTIDREVWYVGKF